MFVLFVNVATLNKTFDFILFDLTDDDDDIQWILRFTTVYGK